MDDRAEDKAAGVPGITIPGPTRATKRSAGMVYLAMAALLGTLLLVMSIRGCQHHLHQHRLHPSSGKWAPTADHVHHAVAFTSESERLPGSTGHDGSSDVEVHRENGKFGMVRRQSVSSSATSTAATATGTVLVDYQVHQPVLTPEGATLDNGVSNGEAGDVQDSCQVVLMDYVFAYSYGEPYIGE